MSFEYSASEALRVLPVPTYAHAVTPVMFSPCASVGADTPTAVQEFPLDGLVTKSVPVAGAAGCVTSSARAAAMSEPAGVAVQPPPAAVAVGRSA